MAEFACGEWLTQDEEEELKNIYAKRGENAGVTYLNSRTDGWKTIPVKFGVMGQSRNERSLFINTISDLLPLKEGAAPLSTNEQIDTKYHPPVNPKLTFCYLPTIGISYFSEDCYLENICADTYDGFVIITSTIFTVADLSLAKRIKKLNIPLYFVRSIVDQDFLNDRFYHAQDHTESNMLERIRNDVSNAGIGNYKLFLIDIKSRIKYEFSDLEFAMINDLPGPKRHSMILSLSSTTERMIQMKAQELRTRCVYKSLIISAFRCADVQARFELNDTMVFNNELSFYKKQLGLDEESLTQRAALMSVDVNSLKEVVSRSLPLGIGMDAVLQCKDLADYILHPSLHIQAKIGEYKTWIPTSFVFDPREILFNMFALHRLLAIMEEASLDVQRCINAAQLLKQEFGGRSS